MDMFPASQIKSVFESLIGKKTVITPIGRRRIYDFRIRVYSGRSCSVVALEADIGFPYTLARSFPMSPKNAYRLVVSL